MCLAALLMYSRRVRGATFNSPTSKYRSSSWLTEAEVRGARLSSTWCCSRVSAFSAPRFAFRSGRDRLPKVDRLPGYRVYAGVDPDAVSTRAFLDVPATPWSPRTRHEVEGTRHLCPQSCPWQIHGRSLVGVLPGQRGCPRQDSNLRRTV